MLQLNDADRAKFTMLVNERLPVGSTHAFTVIHGHAVGLASDPMRLAGSGLAAMWLAFFAFLGLLTVVALLALDGLLTAAGFLALAGPIAVPGLLPAVWLVRQFRQPRLVGITTAELLSYRRTFVGGMPAKFVARAQRPPADALVAELERVIVGAESIMLTNP